MTTLVLTATCTACHRVASERYDATLGEEWVRTLAERAYGSPQVTNHGYFGSTTTRGKPGEARCSGCGGRTWGWRIQAGS